MESARWLGMWVRTLIERRRMVLLAAALLLPYAVLLVLTVQLVRQDVELQQDSSAFRLRQVARSAREAVLAELDAQGRAEVRAPLEPGQRYRNPATVLVGWVEEERLVLPWEVSPAARKAQESIGRSPFAGQLRECERAEAESGADAGAQCYQRLAESAGDRVQGAHALLLAARALDREGTRDRAAVLYRRLAGADPSIADEDGVPLRLYAVQRLLQTGDDVPFALECAGPLADWPWLPPMASFVASEIAGRLGGRGGDAGAQFRMRVHAGTRLLEQAEALQGEFERLGLVQAHKAGRAAWTAYGMDELWLAGVVSEKNGRPALVIFRGAGILAPLEARFGVRINAARDMQGEPLGPELAGLKAAFSAASGPSRHRGPERWMFYSSMALLGAVMIFAAWLVWRDVQRDLRLAQMRSQFVSSVSHELRTPLTSIRMLAETLQMGRGRDPQTQETYLDTIVRECERLSRLVDDILLFSKNEQNRKVYRFRPLEVGAVVDSAVRTLEYPLEENGFRLQVTVEPGLPVLEADGDALEQAVLNLLGNAMKYSGDARDIELEAGRTGANVAIRVRDHGLGIAEDEQQKIFEGFYRTEASEGSSIPGTGLGLALVRQIVKAHGGRVEVESAPGKGSTFTILLPLREEPV
jgi:signal transduction histidine kinase